MKRLISLILVLSLLAGDVLPFHTSALGLEPAITESTIPVETEQTTVPTEVAVTNTEETVVTEPEKSLEESLLEGETVIENIQNSVTTTSNDDLTWTFDSGVLTISGTGPMQNYDRYDSSKFAPWLQQYSHQIKTIIIEPGITSIGESAFYDCNVTSVSIPDTVTHIGESAFEDCQYLKKIDIPDSVTEIGYSAFSDCSSLAEVTLPAKLSILGSCVFINCRSLRTIVIPETITTIPTQSFQDCDMLTSVSLPNTITEIGYGAFSFCDRLQQVSIPSSVTTIGACAFLYSALRSIIIPNSVTMIGDGAFSHCRSLAEIQMEPGNPNYLTSDGVLYEGDLSCLKQVPAGRSKPVDLTGVRIICEEAFHGCSAITTIEIPDSVEEIGDGAFRGTGIIEITIPDHVRIGGILFEGCTKLQKVTLPSTLTSITSHTFSGCTSLSTIEIPESVTEIGSSAFSDCTGLTKVNIPKGVKKIGEQAFRACRKLTEIRLPEGVTFIDWRAFYNCSSLVDVEIPYTVETIRSDAFHNCTALENVYYGSDQSDWNAISIESGNTYLTTSKIYFSAKVTKTDITVRYDITDPDVNGTGTFQRTFDEAYFNQSSSSYNHDLARLSLGMCLAAVTHEEENSSGKLSLVTKTGDEYIREFMENIGCTDFHSVKFDNNESTDDTCAYAYGLKHLESSDTYLIPVAIRGFGYANRIGDGEWVSNFHVTEAGYNQYAAGFKISANKVYDDLVAFVDSVKAQGIDASRIKIWVSGYSRAGAIANLVGANLNSGSKTSSSGGTPIVPRSNIFVYTFATPNTVKKLSAVEYTNVFNIVSEMDIVPRVPLNGWDFTRHGTTLYIPMHTRFGEGYSTITNEMRKAFISHAVSNGYASTYQYWPSQELALDLLFDYLDDWVENTTEYKDYGFQGLLMNALNSQKDLSNILTILYILEPDYATLLDDFTYLLENAETMGKSKVKAKAKEIQQDIGKALLDIDEAGQNIDFLLMLNEILSRMVWNGIWDSNENTLYVILARMLADMSNGFNSYLLMQHWGESYLAWMDLPAFILDKYSYEKVSVKCPVDIIVYDSEGNIVGQVINDVVDESFDERLCITVNKFGEKDIYLPDTDDYQVVVTAREEGELDIVITKYDADSLCTGVDCYVDLPMTPQQVFEVASQNNTVTTENTELTPNAVASGAIPKITITLNQPPEGMASGGGTYDLGESVELIAMDDDTLGFDGWYCGEECLSEEDGFTFSAMEDKTIEARFHKHRYGDWQRNEQDGSYCRHCKSCSYLHTYTSTACGDVTGDAVIDDKDAVYLVWHTLFPQMYPLTVDADYNQDDEITTADAVQLLWHLIFPERYPL